MKTFIRTIAVLVVLNLATACSAQHEEMAERLEEAAERRAEAIERQAEEMAERLEEAAERQAEAIERQAVQPVAVRPRPRRLSRTNTGPFSLLERDGGDGPVFVIPAAEINAQDLVTIMEDMSVMSRIFDKKLGLSPGGIFLGSDFGSFFGHHGARSTEAIFLQGYGALFLMKVDFPLSPPAKEEVEKEPEEDIDELWKETRQEIYEPADARRRRTDEEEEEEYDEEKVEEMKETLIKALKHATNIRNLKADESVILTVAGSSDSSNIISVAITGSNQILIKDKEKMKIVTPTSLSDLGVSSPTVMTIRVKKSDVDAFAKGKLDFDKFRQKVQIFTY